MTQAEPQTSAVVVGAGIVGIGCALALQQRGLQVTVLDPLGPGAATSAGNAGVLARSSLLPFNHPGLRAQLPALLRGQSPGFRWRPGGLRAAAVQMRWGLQFLSHARPEAFDATTTALDALIRHSGAVHRRWMDSAGLAGLRRDEGWLWLYRSEAGFAAGAFGRSVLQRFGVAPAELGPAELAALEPALKPIFARALWVREASAVRDPAALVKGYARWFREAGGRLITERVTGLERQADRWRVRTDGAASGLEARQVVLATGPWSRDLLRDWLGLALPMGFERGYHRHFRPVEGGPGGGLQRPVYDTAAGCVLAPMARGIRLSTGVELAPREAPPNLQQLEAAEAAARQVLALGERTADPDWLGSRPTLPDSRPMIGACPGRPGLWLALGHQHIGLSTGPGSGELLAALMRGEPPPIDPAPFSPTRFLSG